MNVALITTFAASRKEPLAAVLERIHAAFLASGIGDPEVAFVLADGPLEGGVSSVDRVLKRYPALERFTSRHSPLPMLPPVRQISNRQGSPAEGEQVDFATLLSIASGVPRSFPFHSIVIHFRSPAFGVPLPTIGPAGDVEPGVLVGDSWWVNGRNRSVTAVTSVHVQGESKKLPLHPANVAAVLAACGKAKKTTQLPLASSGDQPTRAAAPPPDVLRRIGEVVADFRGRLPEIMERSGMPHDLPAARDAMTPIALAAATGPKKPVLVAAFKPLGYDCRGESGTFTLRRRTAENLTIEIHLDVGTWSRSLTAFYRVSGLGFSAALPLPPTRNASDSRQYQIGDATRWQQIVDNLRALVAELDRSFVPAITAAAGPSPDWFAPENL